MIASTPPKVNPTPSPPTGAYGRVAGLWQPPKPPRPRLVRASGVVAVHDETLAAGFVTTRVHYFRVYDYDRFAPLGLRDGAMVRLDRHSSKWGFYCGLLDSRRDPREAALAGELSLHGLAMEFLFHSVGFSENVYEAELLELDEAAAVEVISR